MRLVLELQHDTMQQHAIRIGGDLNGIFMIMYTQSMRQKTVTMYPPNSLSLRGASLFGRRFANGSPAETDPESVVSIVIGKVITSMVCVIIP
jgi:hypothetical protein